MSVIFNRDFRTSGLIGRSVPMPADFAADFWKDFPAKPAFLASRKVDQVNSLNMEIVDWHLDHLVEMSGYRPVMCERATYVLPEEGLDYETGLSLVPDESWCESCSYKGKITAGSPLAPAYILVSILSHNPPDGNHIINVWHTRDTSSGHEIVEFLQGLLSAFGMEAVIKFDLTLRPPEFTILNKPHGEISLKSISSTTEINISCKAKPLIGFEVASRKKLNEALAIIVNCFPGAHLQWESCVVKIREGQWEEARPWLQKRHAGPWVYNHYRVPFETWTPEKFLQEAAEYEVIPVGAFDYTRGRRISISPALKGKIFHVDLFREGSLWYFAFHAVEGYFPMRRRETIRAALNEYLGQELITRSPEMIWPGLLPRSKRAGP